MVASSHYSWKFLTEDTYDGQAGASDSFGAAAASASKVTAPLTQTLYLKETGDANLINVLDIHQGQIGDCFLLSSIGEEALFDPSWITNMIHLNANGTETVTLYTDKNGHLPTFGTTVFKPTYVTVTNTFPTNSVNNGASQDVVGNQKEIWPQVLEKAVATLDGGYGGISYGGNPVIAMEELTGKSATYMSASKLTLSALLDFVKAGDLIVMDTSSYGNLPYGLYNNHAYMFEKVTGTGASAMVQLGNPWGTNQPTAIPFSMLTRGIVEVDIGHV